MDKETKNRLADYFEAGELVELLGLKVADLIEIFEEEVEEALPDLLEIMGVSEDGE